MPTWPSTKKYLDRTNLPLMVSLGFALQAVKNTIDDADYIINLATLILTNQYLINPCHSHSIINKPSLSFIFNGLFSC